MRPYPWARAAALLVLSAATIATPRLLPAQQLTTETRDANQRQDASFEKDYKAWLKNPTHGSPLVDHLPVVPGIPSPKEIIGYHVGAPRKLTYYADQLKYYRALAAASPRVKKRAPAHLSFTSADPSHPMLLPVSASTNCSLAFQMTCR
jgi:hypothetical protein